MLFQPLTSSLVLVCQNEKDATDREWDDFLDFLATHGGDLKQLRVLVHTKGGAQSAAQRERAAQTLGSTQLFIAAVSDSIAVRFTGVMMALFQRNYRAFSVAGEVGAYHHLRMTLSEQLQSVAAFRDLETQLLAA